MKLPLMLLLSSLLVGCASNNLTVRVPATTAPAAVQGAAVTVEVRDLRAPGVAASTRETAFGMPMGNVTFDPPERQLVKNALEVALAQLQPANPTAAAYTCDIMQFGVNSRATLLYWDVTGVVRLKLKKDDRAQDLFGTFSERTFVWPGEDIIARVVQGALRNAAEGVRSGPFAN